MMSSMPKILHAPPEILNQNYGPLLTENLTLQHYFKLCFLLIDRAMPPKEIFNALLDMYLTFYPMKNSLRTVEQHDLVCRMKAVLIENNLQKAFQLLNESNDMIHEQDDLIFLLSAYCSIFPYVNLHLTNLHIKNALIIRDINNIYFHTVIEPFLQKSRADNFVMVYTPRMHVAQVIGQYEWLLEKTLHDANLSRLFKSGINVLLEPATKKQIEEIVLPILFTELGLDQEGPLTEDHLMHLPLTLSPIMNKISDKIIEEKIVPKLLESYLVEPLFASDVLVDCINTLDEAALKRSCLPFLDSYFSNENEKKEDNESKYIKKSMIKPFITMISKFNNRQEIDTLSQKLLAHFDIINTADVLQWLKQLRSQNVYINDALFNTVSDDVKKKIDKALDTHSYLTLYSEHMDKEQVQRYFHDINFLKESASGVFFSTLINLASLPEAIYPRTLWMKTFEFLFSHRNDSTRHVSALRHYLIKLDFSTVDTRHLLIELCDYAMAEVLKVSHSAPHPQDENYFLTYLHYSDALSNAYSHCQLLVTCVSLMTTQEIKDHILRKIHVKKMDDENYLKPLNETLQHCFIKINDPSVYQVFFPAILKGYTKNTLFNTEYEKLLTIIVKHFTPDEQIYACRRLLKSTLDSNSNWEKEAYLLSLMYEQNKARYHNNIPGFCTGDSYGWNPHQQEPVPKQSPCSVM